MDRETLVLVHRVSRLLLPPHFLVSGGPTTAPSPLKLPYLPDRYDIFAACFQFAVFAR